MDYQERSEFERLKSSDVAQGKRIAELTAEVDLLHKSIDGYNSYEYWAAVGQNIALKEEVERLEGTLVEINEENRRLHDELRPFKAHTCYGPLIAPELMETCATCRANKAEHEVERLRRDVASWQGSDFERQLDEARVEVERMRGIYNAALRYYRSTWHDGPDDEHGVFVDTVRAELAKECSSNECQIRGQCKSPTACRSVVMLRAQESK